MNVTVSLKPAIIYCVTASDADRAIDEVLADAGGDHPIAIDMETAAMAEEAERLKSLRQKLALAQAGLTLLLKKGEDDLIPAKKVEIVGLKAQVAFAETAALDPHRARIRLVQLYRGKRVAVIDLFKTGTAVLRRLDGLTLLAHNAAFEFSFLEHHGVQPAEMHCTMQACRLTLGEKRSGLADAAVTYLGVELDKTHQNSDWSARNPLRHPDRICCPRCRRLLEHLPRRYADAPRPVGGLRNPDAAIPAAARMRLRGFRLDTDAHARMIAELRQVNGSPPWRNMRKNAVMPVMMTWLAPSRRRPMRNARSWNRS